MNEQQTTKAKRIIREHYGLNRPITDKELRGELNNLIRRHNQGTLDDRYQYLYSSLSVAGVIA